MTWGRSGSHDVEIVKVVAEKLNSSWTHLDLGPDNLVQNIDDVASQLGALVSPIYLYRMMWFRDLPAGALVLGGSYGDSVGRAEFSGRTVLELLPYQSSNLFGLLNPLAFTVIWGINFSKFMCLYRNVIEDLNLLKSELFSEQEITSLSLAF